MRRTLQIPEKFTAVLVYGRPPLVFGGMLCAVAVMWTRSPVVYSLGVVFLFVSMSFDLVDGWFAARFRPHATLAHLADRLMDKVVYSIVFPLLAVGMMWRIHFVLPEYSRKQLVHAIFVLFLCITVLIRDNFASFMRGFAQRRGQEPEPKEFTRLRTVVAAPVGALLYAHAFFVPQGPASSIYLWISWLGNLPLRLLFFVEILFLIINFGSIAGYCRKYGAYCLDELCLGNEPLRRKILAFFPNALTVMNAMMGLLAVFFAYQRQIREAYLILIGAAVFDKLDGAMARKLGLTEPLGGQEPGTRVSVGGVLDDIADAVSFCIAPAWIFHVFFSGAPPAFSLPLPAGLIAFFYAIMGMGRLVYFTLDKNPIPGFFKGMPSPAAALLVVAPLVMAQQAVSEGAGGSPFWPFLCAGVMLLAAVVMNIYPVHYVHLGVFMDWHPWLGRTTAILCVVFLFTPYFGLVCFLYMLLYLFSPIVSWRIEGHARQGEIGRKLPAPLK